jgi:sn-glycerol 3-phosphate transport system substrate-binding protein
MSPTVIDVWLADLTLPGYLDPLLKFGEEFERRHPDYRINIEGHNFRTLPHELYQAAAAGSRPAIAEIYYTATLPARDMPDADGDPLFTSVERAVAGRTEILGEPVVLDDIIAPIRDFYTFDGALASMPTIATTHLLYTNRTLLAKAGITRTPTTWQEIDEACRALGGPAITWTNHGIPFQQAVSMQGGTLVGPDNGRTGRPDTVHVASDEMLTWVRWWQRLHRDGHFHYTGKVSDWVGTFQAFVGQQVAFRFSSCTDVRMTVGAAEQAGFDIEVSRLPYNDDVPYGGNVVAGTSLWLTDRLDPAVRDGALAFLQFLNNPRNAADWHQASSFIPVTTAANDLLADEGWYDLHPYHRIATEQLMAGKGLPTALGPLIGDYAGVHRQLTGAMHDVLVDGADPLDRFTTAQHDAQRLLDDYRETVAGGGPRGPRHFSVD